VEPPHIHVERESNRAKFWLQPVRLQDSGGFNRLEIRRLHGIITDNVEFLMGSWDEFFAD